MINSTEIKCSPSFKDEVDIDGYPCVMLNNYKLGKCINIKVSIKVRSNLNCKMGNIDFKAKSDFDTWIKTSSGLSLRYDWIIVEKKPFLNLLSQSEFIKVTSCDSFFLPFVMKSDWDEQLINDIHNKLQSCSLSDDIKAKSISLKDKQFEFAKSQFMKMVPGSNYVDLIDNVRKLAKPSGVSSIEDTDKLRFLSFYQTLLSIKALCGSMKADMSKCITTTPIIQGPTEVKINGIEPRYAPDLYIKLRSFTGNQLLTVGYSDWRRSAETGATLTYYFITKSDYNLDTTIDLMERKSLQEDVKRCTIYVKLKANNDLKFNCNGTNLRFKLSVKSVESMP